MKLTGTFLVLLTAGVYGVSVREALHSPTVDNAEDGVVLPQSNRNGWVNPEDLAPMPQCIAQQDHSTWLKTMTGCTSKRCTNHFGIICTHHQWLTQLSCFSNAFSTDMVASYLPYCGRSILAKAQLYHWIHEITGRTWLVDVGDANGLQALSPASLAKGYAAVDILDKAPTCLTGSASAVSLEPFQHVIASCGFTSTTQHTGNADRPWEYSERLRSMTALDFETVGYDLVHHSIKDGDYFDKECFCGAYSLDLQNEPCSDSESLEFTKERLWIHATCGSMSLPDSWMDTLKTTKFAYIPIEKWHWPKCVSDMPKQVTELTDQCATDACEIDSSGFCKVKPAVDRACVCRGISYHSCGGSCHIFEGRIDYTKWLHNLCSNVEDWHGLPDNWRQLTVPTPIEMIPWRWTLKPSINSEMANTTHLDHSKASETCPSNDWKLGSISLISIASYLAVLLSYITGKDKGSRGIAWYSHPWGWMCKGTVIATLQVTANWFNALIVQSTSGYEDVPVIQLMLLWSSMPRFTWLSILVIGLQSSGMVGFSATASLLFAELILQFLSSYHMLMTVNYGRQHNFYLGGIGEAERWDSAETMYAGALMWLIIIGVGLVHLVRTVRRLDRLVGSDILNQPDWQTIGDTTSMSRKKWRARRRRLIDDYAQGRMDKPIGSEESLLTSGMGGDQIVYGTFSAQSRQKWGYPTASMVFYAETVMLLLLLWISQWFFWGGFIGLSVEEFCPPRLGVLMSVWVAFSTMSALIVVI
ncbi:hypothetical protein BO94DRAFT_625433 [Aspergillus sclerotioniger CBS 115572]|uniref:Uncharacterized protein n=1 Tax=Aspergillus sclerotioniger CBS 115572 TaxID=1450535 RepID=A0A317WFT9_9EURO|nr:hypothetical protein BO94DRAFT_625433 [Aspergillus sclerotioniger CBS 115572]PWY83888.1 hypothetical protein BO94DRAFT_625433 [Aspergillus sclerotioniger CBS 115572]